MPPISARGNVRRGERASSATFAAFSIPVIAKKPRATPAPPAVDPAEADRVELHAVAEMLQVMENAWVGLRMKGYSDLPMYRGWLGVFRRWASTEAVRRHWPSLRSEFGQGFVQFCETQLRLRAFTAAIRVHGDDGRVAKAVARLELEFRREWPSGDTPGPFAFDRGLSFELEAELGEEIDRRAEVIDDDPDIVHPFERHVPVLSQAKDAFMLFGPRVSGITPTTGARWRW